MADVDPRFLTSRGIFTLRASRRGLVFPIKVLLFNGSQAFNRTRLFYQRPRDVAKHANGCEITRAVDSDPRVTDTRLTHGSDM